MKQLISSTDRNQNKIEFQVLGHILTQRRADAIPTTKHNLWPVKHTMLHHFKSRKQDIWLKICKKIHSEDKVHFSCV